MDPSNSDIYYKSLEIVLAQSEKSDSPSFVSLFNLLASISAQDPRLVWSKWDAVLPIVKDGLQSPILAISLSALKALEHFAHSSSECLEVVLLLS
jgi:hypothetical protein